RSRPPGGARGAGPPPQTPHPLAPRRPPPAGDRPLGAPDAEADVLVDKVHGAVAHQDIHPARVPAARGGRALLLRADDAGQVELWLAVTATFGEEDVRAGAIWRGPGVNLAQTGHVDPDCTAEIFGPFGLGHALEVLAKHHRVACPVQDVGQARPVIEAEGCLPILGD